MLTFLPGYTVMFMGLFICIHTNCMNNALQQTAVKHWSKISLSIFYGWEKGGVGGGGGGVNVKQGQICNTEYISINP